MSESTKLFVKPAKPGLVLRDPQSKRELPIEGANVPDTPFWRRRIAHGDVVTAKPAEAKRKAKAPAPSKPDDKPKTATTEG